VTTGGTGGVAEPVDCSGITAAGYELCSSSETTCEAVFTNSAGCEAVCAAAGLSCESALENVDGQCAGDATLPSLPCNSGHGSDYCICSGPSTGTGGASGTGGAAGTGGETATGGASTGGASTGGASTGGAGTGGTTGMVGDLSINDPVPGFASVAGGTTGGGTNLAAAITVSTMTELQNAVKGTNAAIILVQPGTYNGTLQPKSNKTIIGVGPGVKIKGNISISGSDVSNVIIRNIAVQGLPCASYDECRAGADAVYMGNGAHHIWLDHLDISDGQDGNCDATQGADYITVSWTKFYYTYAKEHRFSNLIAGSDDEPNSVGKLRITYMNSHWGERVDTRQPRGRFGNVHMLNNYHNTGGGQIHGVGKDMALIAENCFYEEDRTIWTDMGSPRGWKGIGNAGTADNMNASMGTVFTIPYSYTAIPASQVKAAVTSTDCGAGNTCTFTH
jgi:pectate lyase